MKNKSTIIFIIVIILVVAAFFVFNSFLKKSIDSTSENTEIAKPAVLGIVVPQQAGGTNVFIESVSLNNAGYVVIHRDNGGKPGKVIGVSKLLQPGTMENFLMDIDEEVVEGDSLFAMVHSDDGDGVFDAVLDVPTVDMEGNILLVGFSIVGEGALDNEIKL
jgi:hypothetical protein